MRVIIPRKTCKHGHLRGRPAALLACMVLVLTVPGSYVQAQVVLDYVNSLLLRWPEPAEEGIVVGADSPAANAVWTPWPEPIFKRFGELSMAVPTTAKQQFFKLAPGRQFVEDFSDTWGLMTNRSPWMPLWVDPGEGWAVTDGSLQLKCNPPTVGFGLLPLGTNAEVRLRDFCISVDILGWVTSSTNSSVLYLAGRGDMTSGLACYGGLVLNHGEVPGKVVPLIHYHDPDIHFRGATNDVQLPYRIQFSGVGTQLSLRVLNPRTGELIQEVNANNWTLTEGLVGFWTEGRGNPGDSFTITLDNFFVTGTKP